MGQAKQRGTYEQRKTLAIERDARAEAARIELRRRYFDQKYGHLGPVERKQRIHNDMAKMATITALAALGSNARV